MKEEIGLLCAHCGERFNIGLDSQLVTDEDQIEFLNQIGATGIIHIGTPTRKPDLAGHCVLDEDQKIANLRKLDVIMLVLAQGEQRTWYCDTCKGTNDYPKEWHRGAKKEIHSSFPFHLHLYLTFTLAKRSQVDTYLMPSRFFKGIFS